MVEGLKSFDFVIKGTLCALSPQIVTYFFGGFIEKMTVKVYNYTLSTYINKLGFGDRAATKKPFFSQKHTTNILEFVKAYKR